MGRNRREGPKQLARQIDQPRYWQRVPVARGSFQVFLVGDANVMSWMLDYARQRGYTINGAIEEYEAPPRGKPS